MADDKLKAGPESPGEGSVGDAQTVTKPPVPETVEEPAAGTGPVRQPEQSVTPGMGGDVPAQPAPQVEADKVEKSPDQDKKVEPEEKTAKRRGRPPKEQDSPQGDKPEKGTGPRTGRPAKADKAARGKSPSPALDKVGLLTKCLFIYFGRKNGSKKDAHWRHPIHLIILFKFKAVAERRQWSSAASKPRRKTRVKLCPHF